MHLTAHSPERLQIVRFAVLTVPRTGSKLLSEMLDSHPDILCHTEIFNPKSTYLSRKPHLSIGTKAERDRHPWRFLRKIYKENDGSRFVGFKIMPSHNNKVMLSLLLTRGIKKIVLTRRNWLETFISNQVAAKTQTYHVPATDTENKNPLVKVHVDVNHFRKYLRKIHLYYRAIRCVELLSCQYFHWIDYADIKDPRRIEGLLAFLGADKNVALEERLRKQGTAELSQKIANFREIELTFRGTPWERYLAEDT